MTAYEQPLFEISASVLLKAYACGIFPMAESADSPELHWIDPEHRGALPLDGVRLSRRLARTIRQGRFDVRVDQDFEAVIDGCAASRAGRTSTWINDRIRVLYGELFASGTATRSRSIVRSAWLAGSTVSACKVPFSARACFRQRRTPQRWRSFICARDCSRVGSGYLIRNLSPITWRNLVRRKSAGRRSISV